MLREIRLHGALGRKFGRVHRLAVESAAEAIRALCANFPAFERHLRENSEPGYHVWVGRQNIGSDDLVLPAGRDEPIRISPRIAGAKKGGLLQTIVGVVLIVVGTFVPGMQWLVPAGVALALGGVAQMLTPVPKQGKDGGSTDNKPSYVFSGAVNTTAQGSPVPVLYGQMIVGSAVISAGIYSKDVPV